MLFWVSLPPTAAPFKTHSKITRNMEQAFKLDSSSFEGNKTQGMLFTGSSKECKQKQLSEEYLQHEDVRWIKTSLTPA